MSPLSIFTGPYGWLVKWGLILSMVVAGMGYGAVKMHAHDKIAYDKLNSQFVTFKTQVQANGRIAQDHAKAVDAANAKLIKDNDEKNLRQHNADINTIVRLRRDRDSASSGGVPKAPPNSPRPDLICFDREAYKSAYGELVAEVRGLADEGTANTIDLDSAKEAAHGN